MPDTATCRACHATMLWFKTEAGKTVPLNAAPSPNGNIVVRLGVAIYLKQGREAFDGEPRYTSHFATCPEAARFRKKK